MATIVEGDPEWALVPPSDYPKAPNLFCEIDLPEDHARLHLSALAMRRLGLTPISPEAVKSLVPSTLSGESQRLPVNTDQPFVNVALVDPQTAVQLARAMEEFQFIPSDGWFAASSAGAANCAVTFHTSTEDSQVAQGAALSPFILREKRASILPTLRDNTVTEGFQTVLAEALRFCVRNGVRDALKSFDSSHGIKGGPERKMESAKRAEGIARAIHNIFFYDDLPELPLVRRMTIEYAM